VGFRGSRPINTIWRGARGKALPCHETLALAKKFADRDNPPNRLITRYG